MPLISRSPLRTASSRRPRAARCVALACAAALVAALFAAPALAAIVRQPYLQRGTPTSMTVVWRTDTPSTSRVRYGTVQGVLTDEEVDLTPVTDHIVTVSGLDPDTTYFYDVGTDTTPEAGNSADHFFTTSPVPGTPKPFSAWIVGDSGDASQDQQDVLATMLADRAGQPVDLFLHMGDMAYNNGTDLEFTNNHFAIYEAVSRQTPTWPTIGNHEVGDSDSGTQTGPYYEAFVLPASGEAGGVASGTEAYYSFDYANVHFVVLDSTDTDRSPGSAMLSWLEMDLMSTTQPWVVAYWHHPAYSKGTHDSDSSGDSGGRMVDMRENFLPVLEDLGVDLVLAGHSHTYERSYLIDGVYGFGSAPNFATPALGTLQSGGHILDGGDGDPLGDGAYVKLPGRSSHDGTVYVTSGTGGRSVGASGLHPVMVVAEVEFGSCLLEVDGDSLTLRYLPEPGPVQPDTFTIVKGSLTETFDGFPLGQPVGDDVDWFDGGTGPVVTAGIGVGASPGLAPATSIFTWTGRPFDWNAPGFAGVHLSLDMQTDDSGNLDDDRVGWMIVDNDDSSDNIFGVQIDPDDPGPGLLLEGYWDGPNTDDQRPTIAAIPALAPDTWYRLSAVIKRIGDTAASIDVEFTELDANGVPVGLPLVTGSIPDTSDTVALGTEGPDEKYFTAPTMWPAYKNFTAVDGASDNAYAQVLPGTGGAGSAFQPGDLIIAGFQAWNSPDGQDPGEFIELFNTTSEPISLANLEIISRTDTDANGSLDVDWALSDESPDLSGAVIQPHSFFLIAEGGVAAPGGLHDLAVDMNLATGEGGSGERAIGLELRLGATTLDHVLYGRDDGSDTGANPPGDLDPFSFPRDEVIRNTRGTASFQEGLVRRESAADLYAGHAVFGAYTDDLPPGVWASPHLHTFGAYEARNSQSPPVLPEGVELIHYLTEDVELVSSGPAGDVWRWYDQIVPPSTAYPPNDGEGDAWNEPDFDDSAWPQGPGIFGYGDLDGLTPTTTFTGGRITYLLRTTFEVSQIPPSLSAEILRDDGFILYLNGVEVARDRVTDPVDANTAADSPAVGGDDESTYFGYALDPADLVVGTNTLAVEVHNQDTGSSDLGFDMRLVGGGQSWSYYDQIPFGTATYPVDGESDAWNDPDFDDSGWAIGAGLFGYGSLNGLAPSTVVDNGQGGGNCSGGTPCRITYLFRTTFEADEVPNTLTAQVLRDDGFVMYLNGVEVARDNLSGVVDAATLTDSIVSSGDESAFFSYALDPLAVVVGTNTLAVELHNRDETSSDAGFQMRLSGLETGEPPMVFSHEEDFDDEAPGNDPSGWVDTQAGNSLTEDDSLFSVVDVAGENAFGTSSSLVNIHSHLVGSGVENLSGYQLFGRMRIDSDTGIGVTFMSDYPNTANYYRLRRVPGGSFHLSPLGLTSAPFTGTTDSGVVPVPGTWYRFRIQVRDTGSQTLQRAKIWPDGSPEPAAWQIDAADPQPGRFTSGTFGVWAMATGSKQWDDFFVTSSLLDPSCGDGLPGPGEACDDGNTVGGDCCSASCQFEATGSVCSDGSLCTQTDQCDGAGVCVGSAPLDCDDANECTDDSCDPGLGCQYANNTAACEDGDLCTVGDVCAAGACTAGGAADCNDANACTVDSCDSGLGCVNEVEDPMCVEKVPATPTFGRWLLPLLLLGMGVTLLGARRLGTR